MNIGVLTDNFINLIGANDFLKSIILGISSNAVKDNNTIFVFINKYKSYKKYKGVKRLINKIRFIKNYKIYNSYEGFASIPNVKYIEYYNDINKVINFLKIDCLLLSTKTDENYDVPSIGYLYDCQHKYYPEFFSKEEQIYRDKYFAEILKNYCIVASQDTKNDYVKFYNINPNKIFSLPFTPKIQVEFLEDNAESIIKYNLPKKYFLMSAQFWLHKDHPTLFKAFANLCKNEEFSDVELVCTGTMEDYRNLNYIDELKILIKDLGIEKKLHLLGQIPKIEQIEIMKGAQAVITTTLFEGGPGGGAVWDACALGVPSLISDIPVNLEIKNDLVSFFKAKDVNDLTEKMKIMLKKEKLTFTKEELILKNNENIKKLGQALFEYINIVLRDNDAKK